MFCYSALGPGESQLSAHSWGRTIIPILVRSEAIDPPPSSRASQLTPLTIKYQEENRKGENLHNVYYWLGRP